MVENASKRPFRLVEVPSRQIITVIAPPRKTKMVTSTLDGFVNIVPPTIAQTVTTWKTEFTEHYFVSTADFVQPIPVTDAIVLTTSLDTNAIIASTIRHKRSPNQSNAATHSVIITENVPLIMLPTTMGIPTRDKGVIAVRPRQRQPCSLVRRASTDRRIFVQTQNLELNPSRAPSSVPIMVAVRAIQRRGVIAHMASRATSVSSLLLTKTNLTSLVETIVVEMDLSVTMVENVLRQRSSSRTAEIARTTPATVPLHSMTSTSILVVPVSTSRLNYARNRLMTTRPLKVICFVPITVHARRIPVTVAIAPKVSYCGALNVPKYLGVSSPIFRLCPTGFTGFRCEYETTTYVDEADDENNDGVADDETHQTVRCAGRVCHNGGGCVTDIVTMPNGKIKEEFSCDCSTAYSDTSKFGGPTCQHKQTSVCGDAEDYDDMKDAPVCFNHGECPANPGDDCICKTG